MRINRYKLRHRARGGHRGAQLADKLLARPDRLISLILFGNNLTHFYAAFIWTLLALRVGGVMGAIAGTILLTLIVLIFAEVAPKTWAAARPEKLALMASRVYYPLQKLTWPIIWAINLVAGILVRLTGVRPDKDDEQDLTWRNFARWLQNRAHESPAGAADAAGGFESSADDRRHLSRAPRRASPGGNGPRLRSGPAPSCCPAIAVNSTTWRACCMCASCSRRTARTG